MKIAQADANLNEKVHLWLVDRYYWKLVSNDSSKVESTNSLNSIIRPVFNGEAIKRASDTMIGDLSNVTIKKKRRRKKRTQIPVERASKYILFLSGMAGSGLLSNGIDHTLTLGGYIARWAKWTGQDVNEFGNRVLPQIGKLVKMLNVAADEGISDEWALQHTAEAGAFIYKLVNLLMEHTPQDVLEQAIASSIQQIASSEDEHANDEMAQIVSEVCTYIEMDTDKRLETIVSNDLNIDAQGSISELLRVVAGVTARLGTQEGKDRSADAQNQAKEEPK